MSDVMTTRRPPAMAFDINGSVVHLLHRAGQCSSDSFLTQLASWDLTPRQFAVLIAVFRNEGATQTSLTEDTGIDRSTMVDVVRRLLKRGFLQRRRSRTDARSYVVRLTVDGRAIVEATWPEATAVDRQILSALPTEDRAAFVRCLSTIVAALAADDRPD